MRRSRFLRRKPKRSENEEIECRFSLIKKRDETRAKREHDLVRGLTGAVGTSGSMDRTLEKLTKFDDYKDNEFVDRITLRLDNLSKFLAPSPATSSGFGSSRVRSFGLHGIDRIVGNDLVKDHPKVLYPHPTVLSPHQNSHYTNVRNLDVKYPVERPETLGRWKEGNRRNLSDVRAYLLERKCLTGTAPKEDLSHLLQSLQKIVQTTDGRNSSSWFPSYTERQELGAVSAVIGSFALATPREEVTVGVGFRRRLATIKQEYITLEQLISHTFNHNRNPEDWHHMPYFSQAGLSTFPLTEFESSPNLRAFAPAEEAIRWAQQRRFATILAL